MTFFCVSRIGVNQYIYIRKNFLMLLDIIYIENKTTIIKNIDSLTQQTLNYSKVTGPLLLHYNFYLSPCFDPSRQNIYIQPNLS